MREIGPWSPAMLPNLPLWFDPTIHGDTPYVPGEKTVVTQPNDLAGPTPEDR